MQTENLLVLLNSAQVHEKKKNENTDMKYRKRGRKKGFFHILFFCIFGESKWKTKRYTTKSSVLVLFKSINLINILRVSSNKIGR